VTADALLTYFFAGVWLINGLYCKVLGLVPRHRAIVARILGESHATLLTRAIGAAEIAMTIWILSGIYSRLNAVTQIVVVVAMNILEFFLAPDLLLWGRVNAIVAALFILLIAYNELLLA
jgi:DoxX-like family